MSWMFIKDPVTKIKSVSLTLLVLSVCCAIIAGSLEMFGVVKTTSIFSEFMYSSLALYFGRRLNIGSKNFSSDKAESVKEKIE